VTGLYFVLLLLNLGFYWQKKPILAGICWGLASLIKLYTVPGLMAWIVWVIFSKKLAKNHNQWHYLKNFLLSYGLTVAVVMLPFMLISPKQILDYLIFHQFNQTVGISKLKIFNFFLSKDLILILASLSGIILTRNLLIGSAVLFWLIFYLVFKDLYYVYLGVFAPWLTAGFLQLLTWLKNQWPQNQLGQKLGLSLLILTTMFYLAIWPHQTTRLEGRFTQAKQAADYIQQLEKNQALYGSHEVAPLMALMANKKLYNNHIDTNAQLFSSGALDKQAISKQAVENGVYLLTKVVNIPQNTNVDAGYQNYFDQKLFKKYCQRLKIIEGAGYELFDDIAIYDCQHLSEL
jgi:hypothetical protein